MGWEQGSMDFEVQYPKPLILRPHLELRSPSLPLLP